MEILKRIFSVQTKERNSFQIIIWWEKRRILYNIFLLIAVIASLRIININILEIEIGSGEYFLFLILVSFIIICNLIYTLGWFSELFIKRSLIYGPKYLKLHLAITLICLIAFSSYFLFILN